MSKKSKFLKNTKNGVKIKIELMVSKILFKDQGKVVCILQDNTGDIKGNISVKNGVIKEGDILRVEGVKDGTFDIKSFEVLSEYNIEDYIKSVDRPIDEMLEEMEAITKAYVNSEEGKALNDYYFKDEEFLEKFKKGIGGVSMHHNYIGGLLEHTLNVMYLTSILCERYDCRRKEIAILGAKFHDIGKIHELYFNGPFKYTLRGEMEGHIVIGVQMLDEAFKSNPSLYSEDFMARMKGILVQHHGKLEYGSPRESKTEEAFIVNFADSVDATMNKINSIKEVTKEGTWSDYDRRIEKRLYL